jgi:hypothetical protein
MANSESSVLVIVEGQAACPYWMNHWGTELEGDWSMLEQEEWESSEGFLDRLQTALDRDAFGVESTTIILVASAATDGAAMGTRWDLASNLMNHLRRTGGGELVVTRGFGHRGQPQPALEALVADLVDEWEGSTCTARLELVKLPSISQVRTNPPPREVEHRAIA